jgi:uncharacterized protein YcfJ
MFSKEEPAYAQVLGVDEIKETVQTPREACEYVPVTRQKPVQDQNRVVGTVTGALVGGLLGNQIGKGTGRKIATVAGAAAGGYAGNKVQQSMQASDTYTTSERNCYTVTDTEQKVVGYDVSYRLGDENGKVRMDHKPGDRIPVKDGRLVIETADGTTP